MSLQVNHLRSGAVEAQAEAASLRETIVSLQEQLVQHAARAEQEAQRAQQVEQELATAAVEASKTESSSLEAAHREPAAAELQAEVGSSWWAVFWGMEHAKLLPWANWQAPEIRR